MSDSENTQLPETPNSAQPQPATPTQSQEPPPAPAEGESDKTEPPQPGQKERYQTAWKARSQPTPAAKKASPPRPKPKLGPPPELPRESPLGGSVRLKDLDAQIEEEFKELMGDFSDKEAYAEPAEAKPEPAGSDQGRKKAKVVSVHGADVFLEIPGGRSPGVLPVQQFAEGAPSVGTEVDVHIEGYDQENGLLILSRLGAAVQADWSTVAPGMIVEARVTSTNKGGLAVDVNGIRGFMPISQIDLYRVEDTEQFVNQRLRCLVVEVNPEERNLVVSRRALQEKDREEAREKLWQQLADGQTYEGTVRSVKDFGAFVDLGGVDGLLHVSEMSWSRVDNANQIVQPGQKIKVLVLKVDHERRKVSLGLKQLTASPWDTVETSYPEGSTAKGKVTRLMDFGAFVELEPGLEGLVHISELAPHRVRRVNEVVQPGQEVNVQILSIDSKQRRIALSLKAALPEAEEEDEGGEGAGAETKPSRPRTTPLRGGIGDD
jgi:small subunit ribosomal protein S1